MKKKLQNNQDTQVQVPGRILFVAGMLVLVMALLLSGCQSIPAVPVIPSTGTYEPAELFEPDQELSPISFKSLDDFNNFVKQSEAEGSQYYGLLDSRGIDVAVPEATSQKIIAKTREASAAQDYSETNIQVEGVDEADILKTDGEYIYTVSYNTLFIIKAYPGEDAEVVSAIDFDNKPQGLFINDDYLAVFGNFQDLDFFKKIDFTPRQGMSYFNIYDISDKQSPELLKEYKFEGNYFESRMIDSHVYFITTTRPEYRRIYPTPLMVEGTTVKTMPVRDIYYYPIPYDSAQFANIHAIDITAPNQDVNSKTIVVEGSQNMYMSKNNIYITYTKYINEWKLKRQITIDLMMDELTREDRDLIEKIKQTDNDVLSHDEKQAKIRQVIQAYVNYLDREERDELQDEIEAELKKKLEEYEHMEFTLIHKVSVDNNMISIDANGKVPGHVINQFSMDEYDDVFRIATTITPSWSRFGSERKESTNNIYALDDDLDIMDELEGLAEGESIYSTRFIGDRLYMVTFRQIDPFFVIDLSNPYKIRELGKLKIPGFSRYLHPYDENTIIGIGRDTSETGRTQGLKISLFDVSNVENPEEIAKFVTEERYAQSTAEYEHKAFLFSKEKELLVIPVYSYDYRWDGEDTQGYNGAMVFRITKDSIEVRGIVDHSMAQSKYQYGPLVERSLYIEELLYTKSPSLLRINSIQDLETIKNIELESQEQGPYPIY